MFMAPFSDSQQESALQRMDWEEGPAGGGRRPRPRVQLGGLELTERSVDGEKRVGLKDS